MMLLVALFPIQYQSVTHSPNIKTMICNQNYFLESCTVMLYCALILELLHVHNMMFNHHSCKWVIPEKIHTPPTEEVFTVQGEGRKNVLRMTQTSV